MPLLSPTPTPRGAPLRTNGAGARGALSAVWDMRWCELGKGLARWGLVAATRAGGMAHAASCARRVAARVRARPRTRNGAACRVSSSPESASVPCRPANVPVGRGRAAKQIRGVHSPLPGWAPAYCRRSSLRCAQHDGGHQGCRVTTRGPSRSATQFRRLRSDEVVAKRDVSNQWAMGAAGLDCNIVFRARVERAVRCRGCGAPCNPPPPNLLVLPGVLATGVR